MSNDKAEKLSNFHDKISLIHKEFYKTLKPHQKGKITMMRNSLINDFVKEYPITTATIFATMLMDSFNFNKFLDEVKDA